MKRNRIYALLIALFLLPVGMSAVTLTLEHTIELANDSSLMAFRYRNMYQAGYWQYVSYRAGRLPSLSLSLLPAEYYRYMTQRYDSQENIDVFRQQQMYTASVGLEVEQNFDLLGGTFYLETDLEYMRNFGANKYTQYSSVPVRIGYRQSLVGFNAFKWERKIEPLRYEKAKKELIYNMESVSEQAVTYFFALALAQAEYKLAEENVASCDTLYTIGQRRYKIASISHADLLTLELDRVNARNTLENARIALKRAMFSLASFLGMDKNTEIEVKMPGRPRSVEIPADLALEYAKENNPTLLGHRQTILEGEREVSRTKAESMFNASVNASVGFNQVADNFSGAYRSPLRQDLVSVSISVPLIDWGVRKGKVNMAKNNLNVSRIAARQDELSIEEDIIMTISDYDVRQRLISSASEALDLADMAYLQTQQRFIIGKADINSLTLSLNRRQEASKNYISALQNFWLSHYKIRRLTLHDFETGLSLSEQFDFMN
ncbi:TolC family protein [Duncaniella muris]|jgi:outer membrane protein TolC|uniref:TolC family protein n=2 Tax=Duncaniella TaxID=2518495 RepID=UPI0025B72946|nr:TolC family protein [Duncaniella muris]